MRQSGRDGDLSNSSVEGCRVGLWRRVFDERRDNSGYQAYVACLQGQVWATLHQHVVDRVKYNGTAIGFHGYEDILAGDICAIPDSSFSIATLVCDSPVIVGRLVFDCTPIGFLFGFPVNGARVQFEENIFHQYHDGKFVSVWSVIEGSAVAAQT